MSLHTYSLTKFFTLLQEESIISKCLYRFFCTLLVIVKRRKMWKEKEEEEEKGKKLKIKKETVRQE